MTDWLTRQPERVMNLSFEGDSLVSVPAAVKLSQAKGEDKTLSRTAVEGAITRGELVPVSVGGRRFLHRVAVTEWAQGRQPRRMEQAELAAIEKDFAQGMSKNALAKKYRRRRQRIAQIVGQ